MWKSKLEQITLCVRLYVQHTMHTTVGVAILIVMVTVIPLASWLSLSWSPKRMEESA